MAVLDNTLVAADDNFEPYIVAVGAIASTASFDSHWHLS